MGAPTAKRSKRDVKALLATARRPERSVDICVRADLQDRYAELERKIMDLEAKTGASLAGNAEARSTAEAQAELRDKMLDASVRFTLRGLSRREWTDLVAQYPPREGNEADKAMGFNIDDFVEALIRASIVEPALDDDDWRTLLEDVLTEATYEVLTNAAWSVNKRDVSVPFSRAGLQILGTSESGPASPSVSA